MPFEKGKIPEGAKPFKPGESGNPAGRPVVPDLKELIQENIPESDFIAILQKMVTMAKNGNVKAAQDILDRTFGKAAQSIQHNVKSENVNLDLTAVKPEEIKAFRDALDKEY